MEPRTGNDANAHAASATAPSAPMSGAPWRAVLGLCAGLLATLALCNLLPHDPSARLPSLVPPDAAVALARFDGGKAGDELRVVVVGASLTAGYPYTPAGRASYATLVEHGLGALDLGGARVTCRPVAMAAADAPALRRLCERALELEPDVLCVEVGSNEVGARLFDGRPLTPDGWIAAVADRTTRARALLDCLAPPSPRVVDEVGGDLLAPFLARVFEARPGRPVFGALPVSDGDATALAARVRASLLEIAAIASARGVRVLFLVAPYDLRGSWPRGMVEHAPDVDALVARHRSGAQLDAAEVERAITAHGARADLLFLRGTLRWSMGDRAAARADLEQARDADPAPLHLSGAIAAAVRDAAAGAGVSCFELGAGIDEHPELFLDASHLTLDGHARLARAFASRLAVAGVIPRPGAGWEARFDAAVAAHLARAIGAASIASAPGQMARATIVLDTLCGNLRDAAALLPAALPGLRGEVAGPGDPAWQHWALIAGFLQQALHGDVEALFAGGQDERSARLSQLAQRLWDLDPAGLAEFASGR